MAASRPAPAPAPTRGHSLFLLAHQDDEYFVAPRIEREIRAGRTVACIYLTDGRGHGSDAGVRNRESLTYLQARGVPDDAVSFLGTSLEIPDVGLVHHLDRACEGVRGILQGREIEAAFCPAWEGGHPDHDAAHLVALALGRELGFLGCLREFSLYHGHGTRGRFFRVMELLGPAEFSEVMPLPLSEAITTAFSCFHYKSQWRTWAGLFPQCLAHFALKRRLNFGMVDVSRVASRPHPGALLYERWQRMTWEEFSLAAGPFSERLHG